MADLVDRLRTIGLLRREAEPEESLVDELARGAADRLACSACGSRGLQVGPAGDVQSDPGDWPEARGCQDCSALIPAERLEVFPQATRCAACEAGAADAPEEAEYCPRCGEPMQVRLQSGSSASYQLKCPSCGAVG